MYRVLCTNSGFFAKEIDRIDDEEQEMIQECVSSGDIFILVDDIQDACDLFDIEIEVVNSES